METDGPTRTNALSRFLADERSLVGLISFIGNLIVRANEVSLTAAKALLVGEADEEKRRSYEETVASGGSGVQQTMQTEYAQLFTQMVFQREVDNFLVYLAELLRRVFGERPEALRSSETIKVEEVLKQSTMDELVEVLVERRVERLAYLSLAELQADLVRSLGLKLFDDGDELARAIEVVATRNLIAHSRGIVNARFLRQCPNRAMGSGTPSSSTPTAFLAISAFFRPLRSASMPRRSGISG